MIEALQGNLGALCRVKTFYKTPPIPLARRERKGQLVYSMENAKKAPKWGKKQGYFSLLWPEAWGHVEEH
jgi:hypothetical protein